jgi:hypothetical protein
LKARFSTLFRKSESSCSVAKCFRPFWAFASCRFVFVFSCHHLITRELQRIRTAIMAFQIAKNGA